MANTQEVKIAVTADPAHLIRFARIVEKHMGALAGDLEQLCDPEPAQPDGILHIDSMGGETIKVRSNQ
jgi:hypothetical protein